MPPTVSPEAEISFVPPRALPERPLLTEAHDVSAGRPPVRAYWVLLLTLLVGVVAGVALAIMNDVRTRAPRAVLARTTLLGVLLFLGWAISLHHWVVQGSARVDGASLLADFRARHPAFCEFVDARRHDFADTRFEFLIESRIKQELLQADQDFGGDPEALFAELRRIESSNGGVLRGTERLYRRQVHGIVWRCLALTGVYWLIGRQRLKERIADRSEVFTDAEEERAAGVPALLAVLLAVLVQGATVRLVLGSWL